MLVCVYRIMFDKKKGTYRVRWLSSFPVFDPTWDYVITYRIFLEEHENAWMMLNFWKKQKAGIQHSILSYVCIFFTRTITPFLLLFVIYIHIR